MALGNSGPPLPRGMPDVRDLPLLTDAMLRRGYSGEKSAAKSVAMRGDPP